MEIKNKTFQKIANAVCWVFPILLMIFVIYKKVLVYFVSDDAMMNNISRGFFNGKADEHLIYINVVFGYLTKSLYAITNQVNWYAVIYILLILLSVYTIINVFKNNSNEIVAFVAGLLIECICIYWFTFTVIAYMCVLAGVLKFVDYITTKKNRTIVNSVMNSVSVFVLMVSAFILRDDAFISGCLVLLPLIIILGKNVKNKKRLIVLIPIAICIISVFAINKNAYSETLWRNYSEFNSLRSKVIDFPITSYYEDKGFYKSIGYSENDVECATHWCFGDKIVFSPQNYKKIIEKTPFSTRYCVSPHQFWQLRRYYVKFALLFGICALAFALVGLYSMLKGRKLRYIMQVLTGILFILATVFINKPITRVVIPMIVISIFSLVYMFIKDRGQRAEERKKFFIKMTIVIFAILSVAFLFKSITNSIDTEAKYKKQEKVLSLVNNHKESLYLCQSKEKWLYNKPVMEIVGSDTCKNIMQTGDQDIYNNCYYDQLAQLGVSKKQYNHLLKNLIYKEDTYLIVDEKEEPKIKEMLRVFLKEHMNKNIKYKVVKKIDKNIYVYEVSE